MRLHWNYSAGMAVLLALLVAGLGYLGGFARLEVPTEDWRMRTFARVKPDSKVVVIQIDLGKIPDEEPVSFWGPRLASMIERAYSLGAKSVALDMIMSANTDEAIGQVFSKAAEHHKEETGQEALPPSWLTESDYLQPNTDFAHRIASIEGKRTVLGTSGIIEPTQIISESTTGIEFGDIEVVASPDGITREVYLRTSSGNVGLAAKLAECSGGSLKVENIPPGKKLRFDEVRQIPFVDSQDFEADVFDQSPEARLFKDAAVLIGLTQIDNHQTPIHSKEPGIAGVFVQANAVASILDGRRVSDVPWVGLFWIPALFGLVWVGQCRGIWFTLGTLGAFCCLWMLTCVVLYAMARTMLPMIAPLFILCAGWVGLAVGTAHESIKLKELVRPIVSPIAMEYMMKTSLADLRQGTWSEVTAVFLDLRDSTRHCASMPTEQFCELLNHFLSGTMACVTKHGGYVSRITGDGFLAFFGFPDEDSLSADHAFESAQCMIEVLREFNRIHRAGQEPWRIGIGMHSGPLLITLVGEEKRWELTAIGEAINLASRMEKASKQLKSSLVITEKVRNGLDLQRSSILTTHEDFAVAGLNHPLTIYSWEPPAADA